MHCTQILCHLVVGLAFDKSENPIVMFELVNCCLLFCFFLVFVFFFVFVSYSVRRCSISLTLNPARFTSIRFWDSFRFACSLTRSYLHQYILNWTLNTKLQYCCHLRISHIHLNRCSFCLLCICSIDKARRSSLAFILRFFPISLFLHFITRQINF